MELPILTNTTCCAPSTGCCEPSYPVAILGAGPIGLAAAAHLKTYNIPFTFCSSTLHIFSGDAG